MKLQTTISIPEASNKIDYDSRIVLLGSCFSESIGDQLEFYKFQSTVNPFGIIFNPFSIENLIGRAVDNRLFTSEDVFQYNDLWHCFEVHSECSQVNQKLMVADLNNRLANLRESLQEASHFIITLGTSWVYRYIETNMRVANCFKLPKKEFKKELMTPEEVSSSARRIIESLQKLNQNIQVLFTVSPVRHLKDGFVENNRSKAHLLAGIHAFLEDSENTSYFPSYEIMMDELRDYRFYEADLLHPNSTAIAIIWEKFNESWIDASTYELQKRIEEIQHSLSHKPFHPESKKHAEFLENLHAKIAQLQQDYPHLKF